MKKLMITLVMACGLSGTSFGDQCAWLSPEAGLKAEEILAQQAEILLYCELCDGDKPAISRIENVRIKKIDGEKYREVFINGKPIDLAYAFVPDIEKSGTYKNMSKLVGCESSGVSSTITYPLDSQKAHDDLSGRYKKGVVSWELTRQSGLFHAVVVEFGSEKNGNDRGRLESMSSLEENKLVVTTPLEGCKFILEPLGNALKVLSTKGCGKFGLYLAGVFNK